MKGIRNLAAQRMADLRKTLKKGGLDGYLTASPLEQLYLSGIELFDSEAIFLITPRQGYCLTKRLIASKMTPSSAFLKTETLPYGGILEGALEKIKKLGLKRVVFDPALIDLERGESLQRAGLCRTASLIGEMRMAKYPDEINKIRKACQIAWHAFEEVKPHIKTGVTEEEVRILMALAMYKRGAGSIPFNIVCFGANTADAHHTPSKTRKLKAEEAVLMDFGCCYEGYVSDMTRSWWHGKKEPVEYKKIWNIVNKARQAGIKALRAGVSAGAVDAAVRNVIEQAGYAERFFHTAGHGIGLQEHDRPILRAGGSDVLEENYVVAIEPGIYFDGRWGIRLEDSFLVTQNGSKKLTQK